MHYEGCGTVKGSYDRQADLGEDGGPVLHAFS